VVLLCRARKICPKSERDTLFTGKFQNIRKRKIHEWMILQQVCGKNGEGACHEYVLYGRQDSGGVEDGLGLTHCP
jgi:hypothetical protein